MTERSPPPRIHWPASVSRPVATPIFPSVAYAAGGPDELDAQYEGRTEGWTYSREGHPNAAVLADRLAALEGAPNPGTVTASGMAALTAVMMALLEKGDHVVGGDQLYGRCLVMLSEELPRLGIGVTLADPTDAAAIRGAIRPETRLVLIEVVSNPTLRIADVAGIAAACREAGALLVLDNTFTTPAGFAPFEAGADVVIHSVTKLLAGHSDAMLGWACAADPEIAARIARTAITLGLTPSPFDCWLAERGLHSFPLRFERASSTAGALADRLAELPGVRRVLYPGRADHPDSGRAAALLRSGGNMVSFEVGGGRPAAQALVEGAAGIPFAPTLGDVATVLSHPATSSHRALTEEGRAALGITEGFFRVSVGLEEEGPLLDAFEGAVRAAAAAAT
ncbi:cystathionine gamma-synthase [Hasllibacter halocynthiae]|uniref:Cystathionine gamma-synthase n=1 Tax=Hasllibacter halocynthiae TaxID=595589 RepID=A0A2T0X853_9RHOB|nr:aminotransferase class I/II-fold pyridoxal phosphate-dependent enzyme [Hasllibacter halocynthiae]PRY95131.1 cystathionine gamma-synthase [Hasllibacter halocynthiae]